MSRDYFYPAEQVFGGVSRSENCLTFFDLLKLGQEMFPFHIHCVYTSNFRDIKKLNQNINKTLWMCLYGIALR